MKVVHISSVHSANDPRIRYKQIKTLSENGYTVTLITGDLDAKPSDGTLVRHVPPGNKRRLKRIFSTAPRCVIYAFKEDADVYHFHDPELIPWAILLLIRRKPIIYDIHEDYYTSLRQKSYLPWVLRFLVAKLFQFTEKVFTIPFHKIAAEKYYLKRFPDAFTILNYPTHKVVSLKPAFQPGSNSLLYTGVVSADRGALKMARLVRSRPDLFIAVVGLCPPPLADRMRAETGEANDRLRLSGEGEVVPYDDILHTYEEGRWLAGLALFPFSEHYCQKELTKFFEYMAAGLPIIASNFPVWVSLIEDQGLGICVDPDDMKSVGRAIDWLHDNPRQARMMGERGRRLVRREYNWQSEGAKLLSLYERITLGTAT